MPRISFHRSISWARFAVNKNWEHRNPDIKELQKLTQQRELTLRNTKDWDGKKLEDLGTRKRPNAAAIVDQVVEDVAAEAYDNCDNGNGPFFECVVVVKHFGGACANCHFSGHSLRCSLRKSMTTSDIPITTC